MLAQRAAVRPTELAERIYSPRNCDAARQLFRVTAGLESMIVGEAEVQGQVKRAYELALAAGHDRPADQPPVHRRAADRQARALGDRDRPRAGVDLVGRRRARPRRPRRPPRAARRDHRRRRDERADRPGAAPSTACCTIFVANRHADRARSIAARFGGEVVSLDELPEQLEHADIVVASTASPHPIVGQEELELVMRARDGRPLLLIDLAVPRDIDPACADLRRRDALRHRRPPGARRPHARRPRGRGAARRGDRRGGDPALRRLAGHAGRAADGPRAARVRRRDRRAGAGRERGALGGRLRARPRAGRGDRRARS